MILVLTEAIRSLLMNKLRSFLALLGLVIGTGSVIALVSLGAMVENEVLEDFKAYGPDMLFVQIQKSDERDSGKIVLPKDVAELVSFMPEILAASPIAQGSGQVVYRNFSTFLTLLGVGHEYQSLKRLGMQEGRFLTQQDKHEKVAVLGHYVARDLMQKAGLLEPIGKHLRIHNQVFTIVGVLAEEGFGFSGVNTGFSLLLPVEQLIRISPQAKVDSISAKIKDAEKSVSVSSQLKGYLSRRFTSTDFEVESAQKILQQMKEQTKLFTLFLGAIGSIALLVGGVGVMNVMLIAVTERKKEIGLRMALGAKRSDIRNQFLSETLLLCSIGGLFGIGIGLFASYIISIVGDWQFILSVVAVGFGFVISWAIGLFFGYYPARQASLLDPIVALRTD